MGIEEMMRYESPVTQGFRHVVADVELPSGTLAAGTNAIVWWAGANVDPEAFDDPLTVDLDRSPNAHICFASGWHRCLGSHLAGMELRAALDVWHSRIPEYRIADGAELVTRSTRGRRTTCPAIVVVVVDPDGDTIAYARMDGLIVLPAPWRFERRTPRLGWALTRARSVSGCVRPVSFCRSWTRSTRATLALSPCGPATRSWAPSVSAGFPPRWTRSSLALALPRSICEPIRIDADTTAGVADSYLAVGWLPADDPLAVFLGHLGHTAGRPAGHPDT